MSYVGISSVISKYVHKFTKLPVKYILLYFKIHVKIEREFVLKLIRLTLVAPFGWNNWCTNSLSTHTHTKKIYQIQ